MLHSCTFLSLSVWLICIKLWCSYWINWYPSHPFSTGWRNSLSIATHKIFRVSSKI